MMCADYYYIGNKLWYLLYCIWSNKGPKHAVLLVIKDNKDTYIVVFDGFINILYLM